MVNHNGAKLGWGPQCMSGEVGGDRSSVTRVKALKSGGGGGCHRNGPWPGSPHQHPPWSPQALAPQLSWRAPTKLYLPASTTKLEGAWIMNRKLQNESLDKGTHSDTEWSQRMATSRYIPHGKQEYKKGKGCLIRWWTSQQWEQPNRNGMPNLWGIFCQMDPEWWAGQKAS